MGALHEGIKFVEFPDAQCLVTLYLFLKVQFVAVSEIYIKLDCQKCIHLRPIIFFFSHPLPNLVIWAMYGPSMEMVWHNLWSIYG